MAHLAHAQSLQTLAAQALATDPAVAGAQAQVRAAEQRVFQARAGFGPQVALTGSVTETRYREAPAFDLRPFRAKQAALQVNQPLWRATLFPALDAAQAQLLQAEAALAQAQAESAQRLVEAAFEVLKSRDTLAFVMAQQVAAGEQMAAARRAFQIGTVPVTDVREAEAKSDGVAAQVLSAEAELGLHQQVLAELSGLAAPTSAQDWLDRGLDGTRLPPVVPAGILEWLADAAAHSPQVAQARLVLDAAEAEIKRAWLGHAPTAELTYQYTLSTDTGTATSFFPRRGDSSAVGLNVNIPLFASGATQSKVREAIALRDKALADVDAARRNVSLAVRQSFSAALAATAQARGLEAAVRSQELSLRANRRGYEVGMKVNADVLDAQSKLFEARRDLSRARYDAWSAYTKLKAQAGKLDAADLSELDALMVAQPVVDMAPVRRRGSAP